MSVGDPIRKKGRELHSLARELSEHLGLQDENEWSEDELKGKLDNMRQALSKLEGEFDIPASGAKTESVEDRAAADDSGQAVAVEPITDAKAKVLSSGIEKGGTRSLDPGAFVVRGKGKAEQMDLSAMQGLQPPDLQNFDISAFQKKMADDSSYAKSFLGGVLDLLPGHKASSAAQPSSAFPMPSSPRKAVAGKVRAFAESQAGGAGGGSGTGSKNEDGSKGGSGSADATQLSEFFSQVGSSLVTAQRQLDQRSHEYMAEVAKTDGGRDMATLYRIPKVSAELKFAVEKVDKKGINLLIHRQGTEASTLNQQSVQFEIAAVPAPPETLAAVRQKAPGLDLVFDPAQRQQLFEKIAGIQLPKKTSDTEKAVLKDSQQLVLADPQRVLIMAAGGSLYFIAYAGDGTSVHGDVAPEHRLGVWTLDVEAATLVSIYRFDLKPKSLEDPAPLRQWLVTAGDQQAAFLGDLDS